MKTIIVEGSGWRVSVDIDEEVFPKYIDMTFEAMTQGVEQFFLNKYEEIDNGNEDVAGLGLALKAYEKGHENDIEKEVIALTELVLRNASFHSAADLAREVAISQIKKEQDES
ncbi:hypothetical protein CMI37_32450 [Candidatus Pacearchaeota archaeon]|nr:hypothetical protein [Candidatus Pacearchaeota archaeon]